MKTEAPIRRLVEVRKLRGQARIVYRGTRRIARRPDGHPVDDGGYGRRYLRAEWKARAVNASLVRRGKAKPACR